MKLPDVRNSSGFTLIELLVAISILTVLGVSVYVALNPAQRLQDAQDARRSADVQSVLSAVHQSIVDNKGTYPTNLPAAGAEAQIGTDATGCALSTGDCTITATACADLMSGAQNLTSYLASMPVDPSGGTAGKTAYSVARDANGIVTIKACNTAGATTVQASR